MEVRPVNLGPSLFRITLLLTFTFDLCPGELTWQALVGEGDQGPSPRQDAGLGYDPLRNTLVLFGGKGRSGNGADTIYDDTWIYDIQQMGTPSPWRRVDSPVKPGARFSFVSGVSDGYFYVATGEGPSNLFYQDVWRFNLATEIWEVMPDQEKPSYYTAAEWNVRKANILRPAPRYGAAGGIFPNASSLFVSLGLSNVRHGDTLSYNILGRHWTEEFPEKSPYSPSYPHARCLHAGTMISEYEMVIMGGCLSGGHTGGPCPSGDSWIFNSQAKKWSKLPSCAAARSQASMAMLPMAQAQRRVVLYGGLEESEQVIMTITSQAEQVAVLNPDTQTWTLRETFGDIPQKRASAAMATGPDGIFMFGGLGLMGKQRPLNDLYLLKGDSLSADTSPKQAECHPTFFSLPILHGILMALGWGFFLPWGPFVARYFRHKDPLWFHLHRLFQIFGLLMAMGGFVCGCLSVQRDHFQFVHAIVGLTVTACGVIQPINALLRPKLPDGGGHKPARRVVWEFIHSFLGYAAILLGLANISLGVFLIGAHHIIWILWFAYLGLLLLVYIIAECASTYKNKHVVRAVSKMSHTRKYVVNEPGSSSRAASRQSGSFIEESRHGFINKAMDPPADTESG